MTKVLRNHSREAEREPRARIPRLPRRKARVSDPQDYFAKVEAGLARIERAASRLRAEAALLRVERALSHAPLVPSAEPEPEARPLETSWPHWPPLR